MGSSQDRERIEALLPHRAPFLFVDRIVEEGDGSIITEWDVAPDMDCFRGHYPGEPVLPGVLITEFALQSGAILIYTQAPGDAAASGVPVLARIEDARFKQIVRPGETLRAELKLDESLANARYLSGKITAGGQLVMRLRCVLALTPAEALGKS